MDPSSNNKQDNNKEQPNVTQKTDWMQWCIKNGKMDESELDKTLSTPQSKHTKVLNKNPCIFFIF